MDATRLRPGEKVLEEACHPGSHREPPAPLSVKSARSEHVVLAYLDHRVHQGQARRFHPRQGGGVAGRGGLGLIEERDVGRDIGGGEKILRVDRRRLVDVELRPGPPDRPEQRIDVLSDERAGLAVVAVEEVVHHDAHVHLRIPKEPGQEVGLEFAEFVPRARVRLLEMPSDAVADEKLDVGLEDMEVREGGHEVREIDGVIPEVEVAADPAPVLDVADE